MRRNMISSFFQATYLSCSIKLTPRYVNFSLFFHIFFPLLYRGIKIFFLCSSLITLMQNLFFISSLLYLLNYPKLFKILSKYSNRRMPQHLQRLNISTQHIMIEYSCKSLLNFSHIYIIALLLSIFFTYIRK